MILIVDAAVQYNHPKSRVEYRHSERCSHYRRLIPPVVNPLCFAKTLHEGQTLVPSHHQCPAIPLDRHCIRLTIFSLHQLDE